MSAAHEHTPQASLQDVFLNGARRERLKVVIRLMDGSEIIGRIKRFDRFALLVEHDGTDLMLFKHAVVSIGPSRTAGV
jgi:host factor-I protein|tara:strand:- start:3916 stop:4149 length:234 start_codon:yes stop_codon:yes gene_type:complete